MKCDWKKDLKKVRLLTPEQQRQIKDEALMWVKEDILPMITANVEAIILWQLHANHNKGKKWLLNFLEETTPMINGILDYYDYDTDDDAIWICKHKLKTELGIDVDEAVTNFKATLKLK
jgi:hypothetical protein